MSFKGFKVKDSGPEISGYLFDNRHKYYDISRGIYRFDWLYIDIYNFGLTIDIAKYNNMKLNFNYDGVKSLAQYIQIFKFFIIYFEELLISYQYIIIYIIIYNNIYYNIYIYIIIYYKIKNIYIL
jgi:hypothetical protein